MASSCDCNDYSLMTANTGIATISSANTSLSGVGTTTVLTAGGNGTIIKSIIIKSLQPNTEGMVRLFISDGVTTNLFREIPIPDYPVTYTTPTPAPVWPMIEIDLVSPLELKAGFLLKASTQNAESFNIIAEGLDWAYPQILPDTCCNFKQQEANTGINKVTTANSNLDGTGTIVNVFTAADNGSIIKSITIAALQSTTIGGMIRFFLSPDSGVTYYLMMEVVVPQSVQSSSQPSFKVALQDDFHLKSGYVLAASTEKSQQFAITVEGVDWSYPI